MSGRFTRPPPNRAGPPSCLPEQPIDLTYTSLRRRTQSGELLLRIHHPLSASPLRWTGVTATSGFSALRSTFHGMSPPAYAADTRSMTITPWADTPSMTRKMVKHVLDQRPTPADLDQSLNTGLRESEYLFPFISCTADLDWAIWFIARQLAMSSTPSLHLAIIRRPQAGRLQQNRGGNGLREIFVKPLNGTIRGLEGLDEREKHDYDAALAKVRERNEWLFYGRIFGESIVADIKFTSELLPFALPATFWRPLRHQGNGCPGWLTRLRWDPREDQWGEAAKMMRDKWYDLPTIWTNQPISREHTVLWPPGRGVPSISRLGPPLSAPLPPRPRDLPPRPVPVRHTQIQSASSMAQIPPAHPAQTQRPPMQTWPNNVLPPAPRPPPTSNHARNDRSATSTIQPDIRQPSRQNRARPSLAGQRSDGAISAFRQAQAVRTAQADLMGPEDFERYSLARTEALLVSD